jgi:hypothetical protein
MPLNTVEAKQHAHELLDQLGPGQLAAVVNLTGTVTNFPFSAGKGEICYCPGLPRFADELTEQDRHAVAASRKYFRENPEGGISFEDIVADCGFAMGQIRQNKGD